MHNNIIFNLYILIMWNVLLTFSWFKLLHFKGNMWHELRKNKFCVHHDMIHVSSQVECQYLCASRNEKDCPGYSYSKKLGSTHYCLLCKNKTLDVATNNFGFYGRPGSIEIHWLKRFYTAIMLDLNVFLFDYKSITIFSCVCFNDVRMYKEKRGHRL